MILLMFIVSILVSIISPLGAQEVDSYLKSYIKLGLNKNLELGSAKQNLIASAAREDQAFSNFLPKLEINSRYTRAGGGRSFVFPLGTMMNALYDSVGIDMKLNDETVPFLRPEEQDTKLELVQPIFNYAILYAYDASNQMKKSEHSGYRVSELNIAEQIITQYYNCAKARKLVEIGNFVIALVNENLSVAQKLYNVGKAPKTDVLRAEVQVSSANQELSTAKNMATLSRGAFNTTLNRPHETEVLFDSVTAEMLLNPEFKRNLEFGKTMDEAIAAGMQVRPEFDKLNYDIGTLKSIKKGYYSDYLPSLTLVADYGIQGEKYKWDKESRYWMVSGMFKWNLFSGFASNAKQQETEAQINSLNMMNENVKQLITLEIKNNYLNYTSAFSQYDVAVKTYRSAEENYRLTKKSYEQGMAPFISLLDAETTLNVSMENLFVTYYEILTTKWKLKKSIGLINNE